MCGLAMAFVDSMRVWHWALQVGVNVNRSSGPLKCHDMTVMAACPTDLPSRQKLWWTISGPGCPLSYGTCQQKCTFYIEVVFVLNCNYNQKQSWHGVQCSCVCDERYYSRQGTEIRQVRQVDLTLRSTETEKLAYLKVVSCLAQTHLYFQDLQVVLFPFCDVSWPNLKPNTAIGWQGFTL